jgi:hypothetical protein
MNCIKFLAVASESAKGQKLTFKGARQVASRKECPLRANSGLMHRNKKDCLLGKTEAARTQMEWKKDDISRLKIMTLCVPRGRSGFKNLDAEYTQATIRS